MSEYEKFLKNLPEERQKPFSKLVDVVRKNIPQGFEETFGSMVNFEVPLNLYPNGYHCSKNTPLPFVNIANQKNFIALYHMGIYADPDLLKWFQSEYPKHSKYKLNMGKSCIRFKYLDDIPYQLIAELASKVTTQDWIATYESAIKRT